MPGEFISHLLRLQVFHATPNTSMETMVPKVVWSGR
jgi:hypothetical protein